MIREDGMDIFLWNKSPGLNDPEGQLIAEACDRQMQEDVAPAYGLQPPPRVSFVPGTVKGEDLPGNCLVIIFADAEPEALAAAAAAAGIMTAGPAARDVSGATTRDWDDAGRNFARVYPGIILDNEGTLSTGPHSISAVTSHECIEATYDRNLEWWAWNENDKKVVAAEVCDQVEDDAYTKRVQEQDVAVSNFVYPAWFDARAPAGSRFDQMQRLSAPFSCSEGGYLIVYNPADPDAKVHMEPEDDARWGSKVKGKLDGFARTRERTLWNRPPPPPPPAGPPAGRPVWWKQ
jgi:hypothetical protein